MRDTALLSEDNEHHRFTVSETEAFGRVELSISKFHWCDFFSAYIFPCRMKLPENWFAC